MPKKYNPAPCSVEELRKWVHYNPETGALTWIVSPAQRIKAGTPILFRNRRGYIYFSFRGKCYLGHRIAWFLHTGGWPQCEIDHINRIRDDNRIANLREVNLAEQARNKGSYKRIEELPIGVYRRGNRFRAVLQREGRWMSLGTFDTPEEAHKARAGWV